MKTPLSLLLLASLLASPLRAQNEPDTRDFRTRIQDVLKLVQKGDHAGATRLGDALHKELSGPGEFPAKSVGGLKLYRFMALYMSRRHRDAWALATAEEPKPFSLHPANQAYMASVMAELGMLLGKPLDEIVRWGQQAVAKREEAKDTPNAVLACRNTSNILARMQAEDRNTPFAQHMIRAGVAAGNADWILEGHERLRDGLDRARKPSPGQIGDLERDLKGVTLSEPLKARLAALRARLTVR